MSGLTFLLMCFIYFICIGIDVVMKSIFGESFKVILLPYVAMGISILLIMLLIPICKLFKKEEKTFNTPRTTHFNKAESARKARGTNCNDFSEISLTSTNSQRHGFSHSPTPKSLVSHKKVKKDDKLKI